jgi:hypothetical protein
MPDFTNANLTQFIGQLVDTYLTIPWAINNPVRAPTSPAHVCLLTFLYLCLVRLRMLGPR